MEEKFPEKGFGSLEEHMQEYVEAFLGLQQEQGEEVFRERRARLERREGKTEIFLPSVCLREQYLLTQAEYWIMMFAFCCELEDGLCLDFRNKYRENRPVLQYILHLLSGVMPVGFRDMAGLWERGGALWDVMAWEPEEEAGLMERPLKLDPAVFRFLLTGGISQEDWYTLRAPEEAEGMPGAGEFFPLHGSEYQRLCGYLEVQEPLRILLYGVRGSGCRTLVRRACGERHVHVLLIRMKSLFQEPGPGWRHIRQTLCLLGILLSPVAVLEFPDRFSGQEKWEQLWERLSTVLTGNHLCFLARTRMQADLVMEEADTVISLEESLSREETGMALDVWLAPEERRPWQEEMLGHYRLNIGEWNRRRRKICLRAKAEMRSPADSGIWQDVMQERQEALRFGRLIEDKFQPEEIILPEDCRKQLETVTRLARAWRGEKGLQLLFYGTSGTGKTMAASVLAGQLRLPLWKVDLSQVFDKYIGETEKHVDEIFRTAGRNHYLLFFDEADALFSKRTAVKDSHDRYANVSAAYLLQRMEEYKGIVILATNLRDHFDDAFVRRIRFAVKFRDLDKAGRERLWRKVLEGGLPVAQNVDFGALADAAQLSPARISSAAHVAVLLAACHGDGVLSREHLREALALEAGKDETAVGRF